MPCPPRWSIRPSSPGANSRSRTCRTSATSVRARSSGASKNAGSPTANAAGHGREQRDRSQCEGSHPRQCAEDHYPRTLVTEPSAVSEQGLPATGWRRPECHKRAGEHRDGSGTSATAGRKTCRSAESLRARPASAVSGWIPALEASLRRALPNRAKPPDLAHDHRTANPPAEMLGLNGETRIGSGHSEDG